MGIKIYLPDPYGPQEAKDHEDAIMIIQAYIHEQLPDFAKFLDSVQIEEDGTKLKVMPGLSIIELKEYVKMKNFMQLKINALQKMADHFNRRSFQECPECGTLWADKVLACMKCGYANKLNDGVDNI